MKVVISPLCTLFEWPVTMSSLCPNLRAEPKIRPVVDAARSQRRILLTEDKDFGQLVFAAARASTGVVLIRWPVSARGALGAAIVQLVASHGDSLAESFVVVEPGRVRFSRSP